MTEPHWRRFVCNLPTRSEWAAISEQEWFDQQTGERIPAGQSVWVGLDLGWKFDTTAIVPMWWRDREFRLIGDPEVIVPPRNGVSTDPAVIEEALRRVHGRNPIEVVVMDPHRGEQMAVWIRSELGCEVIERQQTLPLQALDFSRFMEGLRQRWLWHTGHPAMTRHALNAVARELPRGDAVFERPHRGRAASEQDRRVIDALDAAAMVHSTLCAELDKPVASGWRGL